MSRFARQRIRRFLILLLAIFLLSPATSYAEPGVDPDQARAREEGATARA